MKKTDLCKALREFLADKEDIANDAAPALLLMRHSLVELEKPTSAEANNQEAVTLRHELAAADREIARLADVVTDREGYIYGLLAEVMLVPEVDDEPVDSLQAAIELMPNVLDELQGRVSSLYSSQENPDEAADKDRFIAAVRQLLGGEQLTLQGLWNELENKSKQFMSLEVGLAERDRLLGESEARLMAIREKLGIPAGAVGSVEQLELANIDLLTNQRREAQDSLLARIADAARMPTHMPIKKLDEHVGQMRKSLDDANTELAERIIPSKDVDENTLEAILEQIITILRLDWQDVETLPQHIENLLNDAKQLSIQAQSNGSGPLAGWVSDCIDLAHAVRGNLAPENRVMAKAAEAIILSAPGVDDA